MSDTASTKAAPPTLILGFGQRLRALFTGKVLLPVAITECKHDYTNWTNPTPTEKQGMAITGAGPQAVDLMVQSRVCTKCNFNQRVFS